MTHVFVTLLYIAQKETNKNDTAQNNQIYI